MIRNDEYKPPTQTRFNALSHVRIAPAWFYGVDSVAGYHISCRCAFYIKHVGWIRRVFCVVIHQMLECSGGHGQKTAFAHPTQLKSCNCSQKKAVTILRERE